MNGSQGSFAFALLVALGELPQSAFVLFSFLVLANVPYRCANDETFISAGLSNHPMAFLELGMAKSTISRSPARSMPQLTSLSADPCPRVSLLEM